MPSTPATSALKPSSKYLLGVDTGGTFTDFVLLEDSGTIRIHKVLSTPQAPEQAILQGVEELGLLASAKAGELTVVHGSTVATNAALEGKGVRTAFITNRGFKDLLSIGRQTRPELYNLQPSPIAPPVPSELCLETGGRLGADGQVIEALTDEDLSTLVEQIKALKPDAAAINLLFSFLDSEAERRIETALSEHFGDSLFTSRSSFVLPEYKEYERGIATWLNSWLGPLVERYLQNLQKALDPAPVAVMQSSGGTIDAAQASQRAVNMLLSGPAGGLAAALYVGKSIDSDRLLTFDMGGTSTDVALIDGDIRLTNEGRIGPYPAAVPMVDMHTIGAGGGSIAWIDQGGLLQVGPESAGAAPGPACYGKGGAKPTVTDANALLGRLRPEAFLGGTMELDIEAARKAIATVAKPLGMTELEAAEGILQIANEHMTRALRVISVQQGHDPKDFQLACFGGAGGLHVCALAEELDMNRALVPMHSGVLSALGMLVAPRQRQLSRTHQMSLETAEDCEIEQILETLANDGIGQLTAEGVQTEQITLSPSLDLRYQGQSFTLNVPWQDSDHAIEAFHKAHQLRYGHRMEMPVELVNVRLALNAATDKLQLPEHLQIDAETTQPIRLPGIEGEVRRLQRSELAVGQGIEGPALIIDPTSTTLVTRNWAAELSATGHLLLTRIM